MFFYVAEVKIELIQGGKSLLHPIHYLYTPFFPNGSHKTYFYTPTFVYFDPFFFSHKLNALICYHVAILNF